MPYIIKNGAEAFRSVGTEKSAGTKVFALTGKINNTGLVEVPMGMTLREVIYDIGGGVTGGKALKAVQIAAHLADAYQQNCLISLSTTSRLMKLAP